MSDIWGEDSPWIVYHASGITRTRRAILEDFTHLEFVLRFNDVGTWQITLPAGAPPSEAFVAFTNTNWTVHEIEVCYRKADGSVITVIDGPITRIERRHHLGEDTLVVSGLDRNVWLADCVAIPSAAGAYLSGLPTESLGTQWPGAAPAFSGRYTGSHFQHVGPVSGAMAQLASESVNRDVARTSNPVAVNAPNPPIGDTDTYQARFGNVLETLQQWAIRTSGLPELWPLQFRITGNVLSIRHPTDTGARFAETLGNVNGYSSIFQADEANWIIVGGAGDLAQRMVTVRLGFGGTSSLGNQAPAFPGLHPSNGAWRRIESFRDRRDANNWDVLIGTGLEEARKQIQRPTVSIEAVDVPNQTALEHYQLGDVAEVWVSPTERIRSVITQVHVTLAPGAAPLIVPTIGFGTPAELGIFNAIGALQSRVANLDRGQ